MGQGGQIMLINATTYDWHKTQEHSYQMNSWSFPDTVKAGGHEFVYVEWNEGFFNSKSDDSGEVTYALSVDGKKETFEIQARAGSGYMLQAALSEISTQGKQKGGIVRLGWRHNGVVSFILAGAAGGFVCNETPVDWMQRNLSWLGRRKLREICMPGAHDAGMSKVVNGTALAVPETTQNQTLDIYGQLTKGVRYFDIRPVIGGGHFHAGHYTDVELVGSWQGARGQSITEIIENVNRFTSENKELIILYLSHDVDTDAHGRHYTDLTQADWDRLVKKLESINGRYVISSGEGNVDLTQKRLDEYIGGGKPCVLIVADTNGPVKLGSYEASGVFAKSSFSLYDSYADQDDVDNVIKDQIDKMARERKSPDANLFLLSWTLTFGPLGTGIRTVTKFVSLAGNLIMNALGLGLRDEATKLNALLPERLWPKITKQTYPNIIHIDNVLDTIPTALSIAISFKANAGIGP